MALKNYANTTNSSSNITVSLILYSFILKSIQSFKQRFAGVIYINNETKAGEEFKLIKTETKGSSYTAYECRYDKQDFADSNIIGDILLFFRRESSTTDFNLNDCVENFLKNNKNNNFKVHGIIISDNKTKRILCYKVFDDNINFIVEDQPVELSPQILDVSKEIDIINTLLDDKKKTTSNTKSDNKSEKTFSINDSEKKIIDKGVEFVV